MIIHKMNEKWFLRPCYSLLDVDSNILVQCENVDKREVHLKSPNMEQEGLHHALTFTNEKLQVQELVTDASSSVSHMMSK